MARFSWAFGLVLAGFATNAAAENYIEQCAKALVPEDIKYLENDLAKLALYSVASKNKEGTVSGQGGLEIAGIKVSGSGSKSSQESVEKRLGVQMDRNKSILYLSSFLPQISADAFNQCVQTVANSEGPHIIVKDSDDEQVTIRVIFRGGVNVVTPYTMSLTTNGEPVGKIPRQWLSNSAPQDVTIRRRAPGQTILANLNMTHDGLPAGSDSLKVGPIITYTPYTTAHTEQSAESVAVCTGNEERFGDVVEVSAGPGERISKVSFKEWPTALQPDERSRFEVLSRNEQKVTGRAACVPAARELVGYYHGYIMATIEKDVYKANVPSKYSGPQIITELATAP